MRGHRLLFVLASFVALGLVGFANFPSDRYAVTDVEASQLVGGGCTPTYGTQTCTSVCPGGAEYLCCNGTQDCDSDSRGVCGGGTNVGCCVSYNGCNAG